MQQPFLQNSSKYGLLNIAIYAENTLWRFRYEQQNLLLQLQRLPAQARKTQKTSLMQPSHRSKKCLLQATRYSLSVSALLKPVSVEREPLRILRQVRKSLSRHLRLRHLKQARLSRMPSISKPNYKAKGTAIEMIAVPFLNIYLLLHITEAQNIPSFTSKRQIPP